MEEFFEKGTLPVDHILEGMRQGVREMRVFPVMCASALHNIGSDLILDLVVEDMPNPTERGEITAFVNGVEAHRPVAESDLPSAYVFKTTADPFAGRITYFRVDTGIVKNDANLQNVNKSSTERLAHLSIPVGKTLQPVTELQCGRI